MNRKRKIIIRIIYILIFAFLLLTIQSSVNAAGIDGTTIVLNPGHGGDWTGCANGSEGLIEKDLTLKIAKYLKSNIEKYYNVKVILTHDGVNFPNNDAGDLAARAMIARNNNADLYVSLHIDDNIDKTMQGATVYVTSRTELPKYKEKMTILGNMILNRLNEIGIQTSKFGVVNDKLCNDKEPVYQYYDGSQADYYGDIRHAMKGDTRDLGPDFSDGSGISTVLIEHCYMNNSHDVTFLNNEEGLKKIAKADCDAIVEYFGLRPLENAISTIDVDKEFENLIVGNSTKVIANVGPDTAENKKINWTSSNTQVASVDDNGNILAIGEGIAKITATSDDNPNVFKTININVEDYRIEFEKETEYIALNKKKTINATIYPSWIENKNIIWESSNPSIIEVDQNGEITAHNTGSVTIKLTWQDKNISSEIVVNAIELSNNTTFQINKYTVNRFYLSKIGEQVTLEDFIKNIDASDDLEVQVEKNTNYIGTGTILKVIHKESNIELERFTCLIYADVNGDGKISAMDYAYIKNHIMDVKKITDKTKKIAADVNEDGKISAMDYAYIKNHIMDVKKITLK